MACLGAIPAAASPGTLVLTRPIDGAVLRGFDDVSRYAPGHRGVDLAGQVGEPVRAAAAGTVSFAGSVAGVGTVTVDHGAGWFTTYQPVSAQVSRGEVVESGTLLGTLALGHCPRACLHWGLTDKVNYANPLAYVTDPVIALVPLGFTPKAPPAIAAATAPSGSSGGLPVTGRISSRFGMRIHPITGAYKLHDGTDFAAPCGTPIVAPRPGVVTRTQWHSAYGWRVSLDHGGGLTTSYNHLPGITVSVGQQVAAGERIGTVGSTGLSTGCHLHWMAWRNGTLLDPLDAVS